MADKRVLCLGSCCVCASVWGHVADYTRAASAHFILSELIRRRGEA